jgi:hypothetical protein
MILQSRGQRQIQPHSPLIRVQLPTVHTISSSEESMRMIPREFCEKKVLEWNFPTILWMCKKIRKPVGSAVATYIVDSRASNRCLLKLLFIASHRGIHRGNPVPVPGEGWSPSV